MTRREEYGKLIADILGALSDNGFRVLGLEVDGSTYNSESEKDDDYLFVKATAIKKAEDDEKESADAYAVTAYAGAIARN